MEQLPGLPTAAFDKADPTADRDFYSFPRFVTHIDEAAIATVTANYRLKLPRGRAVLDVMSSWVSHLPPEIDYKVTGHGLNAQELAANPRLEKWFVQDLNTDPILPLPAGSLDAATLCVSVQYLQRPVEVFRSVADVLKPGAPFIVSFSDRCFPTKAVAIWQALSGSDRQRLVCAYMTAAGFAGVTTEAFRPSIGDPLWTVIGQL